MRVIKFKKVFWTHHQFFKHKFKKYSLVFFKSAYINKNQIQNICFIAEMKKKKIRLFCNFSTKLRKRSINISR